MTHIDAMKQGLEALEEAVHYTSAPVWSPSMTKECNEAIASLRQAIAEFDSHTLYREGYVNGYAFGEAAGKRQAIKELESQDGNCQHCAGSGCVACDARKVAHDVF